VRFVQVNYGTTPTIPPGISTRISKSTATTREPWTSPSPVCSPT
jgi:hypothetical protein